MLPIRRWSFSPLCACCPARNAVVASLARTSGAMKHPSSRLRVQRQRDLDPVRAQNSTDAIKDVLSLIKTQSSIRFVALPFFLGAEAVLAKSYYEAGNVPVLLIAGTALCVCIVAFTIEVVLSRNLIVWWKAIARELPDTGGWSAIVAHRSRPSLWVVRFAFVMPYAAALAFWLHKVLLLTFRAPSTIQQHVHDNAMIGLSTLLAVASCIVAYKVWREAESNGA